MESARFCSCDDDDDDCCPRVEEKECEGGNTESTASKNMSSNSAAKEASKTWNGRKEVVNIMFTFDVVRCVCVYCVCVFVYCIVYLLMKNFPHVCLNNSFFLYILYL